MVNHGGRSRVNFDNEAPPTTFHSTTLDAVLARCEIASTFSAANL